jgi:hypothetical protein
LIPKANQRAGGWQLATHLLNEFDNDRVELAEVRGAMAADLHGALEEWEAAAKATRCKKYLYSLSINPDPEQRPLTRAEYFDYIARVEKALGLANQARAVVFHVKYGREHCHVVWSRIDGARSRAVPISHDRQKLRTVTRDFARAHCLTLPEGLQRDSLTDRFNRRQKRENLAEKQQEERTGITKAERLEAITAAWRESESAETFIKELEKRGYLLARGDRRAYVVVDLLGEIHSVTRLVRDAKASEIKSRLAAYSLDDLPDASQAQEFARKKLASERTAVDREQAARRVRTDLEKAQRVRRDALDQKRKALFEEHRAERDALASAHAAHDRETAAARLRAQRKGVLAFIQRITGIKLLLDYQQKRRDQSRAKEQVQQRAALKRRHERETLEFQHRYRALRSLEQRERLALETRLKREQFRRTTRGAMTPIRRPEPQTLTTQQRDRLDKIAAAAREVTESERSSDADSLAQDFREAVEWLQQERHNRQHAGDAPSREAGRQGDQAEPLRSAFNRSTKTRDGGSRDERHRQRPFTGPLADREPGTRL